MNWVSSLRSCKTNKKLTINKDVKRRFGRHKKRIDESTVASNKTDKPAARFPSFSEGNTGKEKWDTADNTNLKT